MVISKKIMLGILPMAALSQPMSSDEMIAMIGENAVPKMNARKVTNPGEPIRPVVEEVGSILDSNNAVFVGICSPNQPFTFPLSGGAGYGAVGFSESAGSVSVSFEGLMGTDSVLQSIGEPQANFFPLVDDSGMMGMQFQFQDVPSTGEVAKVECSSETNVMVVYQDDSPMSEMKMSVSTFEGTGNTVMETFTLLGGMSGSKPLEVESFVNALQEESSTGAARPAGGLRKLQNQGQGRNPIGNMMMAASSRVGLDDNGNNFAVISHDLPGEIVLVQAEMVDEVGNNIMRTFITKTREVPPDPIDITLASTSIDENGDISITLAGFENSGVNFVDISVRVGVSVDGTPGFSEECDTRAVVWVQNPVIKVHGGWIRTKLQELDLSETMEGWDVVLVDAYVSDPENGQRMIGRLAQTGMGMGMGMGANPNRGMLSAIPAISEMTISEEMLFGRKPEANNVAAEELRRRLMENNRELQQTQVSLDADRHSKIIVHGYCDRANSFPPEEFSPVSRFTDPEQGFPLVPDRRNWSNLDFAQRIWIFQFVFQMQGCGVIAHSQGGLATLTLHQTYFSCLDFADRGGSRLITSMGSPYQGSGVAGNVAVLGELFGIGCGFINDLTLSGATAWLAGINSFFRSRVHYYRTRFRDELFRFDFCNLMTDLFLPDPDDGIVSEDRGVLPGGNNRGVTSGECHSDIHRDPPQYLNSGRNAIIDNNLRY